ncbi:MAG: bifunctional demethylmenaquinone methyltransferase/2-methoxy-6-polyprenyl-1,4-benzoquinol methylase UbiE [Bacteroidales bacterium]|nr:bifunctional demethylmenaquinone methyltransferase/2-methoxy-6-polyprenyl-1,4-benzoquinol methylase UbiE [Candidatus Cacconaster merdequi]
MDSKKNIGALFDRIASRYDRFNHVLSLNIDRSWRRKAVQQLRNSGRVLDVAIGTADLAVEMLKRGKARKVEGIDLSRKMMEIGKRKVAQAGFSSKVTFVEGNALQMPYEDGCFDAATCAFGVRNFSDLDKGLSEIHRVLRPGGQLLILEFSYPTNKKIRAVYNFFFTHIMPLVGRVVGREKAAFTYFRESVKGFIWGEAMVERLYRAGFRNPSYKTLTFGIATIYTADK